MALTQLLGHAGTQLPWCCATMPGRILTRTLKTGFSCRAGEACSGKPALAPLRLGKQEAVPPCILALLLWLGKITP